MMKLNTDNSEVQCKESTVNIDEEYYDAKFSESDSDLESIPTTSHFRQHTWKNSQSGRTNQSSFNESNGMRRLLGKNGEYIEGKWQNEQFTEILSFQFTDPNNNKTAYVRKQSTGYLFSFDEEDFIARVCFDNLEQLNFTELFTTKIKRSILAKLIMIEVIKDKLLNDRNTIYEQFKQLLQDRSTKSADKFEYAEDLFQFSLILRKKKFSNKLLLNNIFHNQYISSELKTISRQLLNNEEMLNIRQKTFSNFDQFYVKNLFKELQQTYESGVNNHRNALYDKYLWFTSMMAHSTMVDHFSNLHNRLILYISNKDMVLFSDLIDMMKKQPFLHFINNSLDALFSKLNEEREYNSLKDLAPLTHPIYFFLCKSFQELVEEISGKTNMSANDLLKNQQGKWSLAKSINWLSTVPLNQSLEQQYRFIFKLMEHFQPGCYSNKRKFEYKPKLIQDSDNEVLLQQIKDFFVNLFGNNQLSSISQERLVWIYILDNAIVHLLSKKELKLFEPLLQGYIDFIRKARGDHYESFRVLTHNTVRFIVQTSSYFSTMSSQIDQAILTKQIEFINKTISDKQFNYFRDLIEMYNEYWKNREHIIEKIPDKFPYGKFKQDMEKIRKELLDIVNTVLGKQAKPQTLITCFRSFNEFLEDLNALQFNWFIKEVISDLNEPEVKLINEDKRSYQVLDPENFIKRHENIPCHYLIEITEDLLNSVNSLLNQKEWSNENNLNATSELLSAIRKSFLYLKDQPDYVSFDIFKKETTDPFIGAIKNSCSYEDFEKRIHIIGESFWYLRKQDEIDICKALDLYKEVNNTAETVVLDSCYNQYLTMFNFYIQQNINENYENKIKFITEEVKKHSNKIKINEWGKEFKSKILPKLLAGLAAVWSVEESKDIANTGKSLKPHCIQILCILRLLSADKDSKGVDKHLAQVLTGQGKSLILCLLSSLLALMGHDVRIICYSKYLVIRDHQNFIKFFEHFGITNRITYGTFKEMANEILMPEIDGRKQNLRKLVQNRILNRNEEQFDKIKEKDISNTILLIDEVDVFFSDQFYGNNYSACTIITIPALANIQEKIWELASKHYEKNTILKEVEEFIKNKKNEDFKEFNKFFFKSGKYCLLKEEDNSIMKEYTNQSLYEEHLDVMINNAIEVAKGNDKDWFINRYKINDDGVIAYRNHDGIYCTITYNYYYNIFNYFRLKKKDFNPENYGYLNIYCGDISYAKLPEKYPLILGVSGTLTTLNEYERKAIKEFYNINENSVMPSFFGPSKLKFDTNNDVIFEDSEEGWHNTIFNHANSKINSQLSVIIFFTTDLEIDKFKEKFLGKFDRLHVLTENTEAQIKKKYIDEAGITKTITLSTRGIGRGIDFKSSVAVERNGGVHVIQTFFSLDIKEETQIKGRTARKDNKGSYELILCREHLIKDQFLKEEETDVNYKSLCKAREEKMKIKGSYNETRIKKSEDKHKTTMDFLKSFFEK